MKIEERNISRAARRKMAQRARKTAKRRATKRKLMAKRMKNAVQLKAMSQKAAKNILVKKMTGGKSYNSLSIGQKELIDKKLAKKPTLVNKVARKILPKVKAKEKERVKKVRQKMTEPKNESLNTKHGVVTLNVNGSYPEVSGRYINNKLVPYTFKSKEDAKKHCKNVGGKPFESMTTGKFYVEFTKLDGPVNEDIILEKATSKSQQRLFGMVHAYNKGELSKSDVDSDLYSKIKKIAKGMTKKDTKKMAKTNHDDLPEKAPQANEGVEYKNESKSDKEDLENMLKIAKSLNDKSLYFKRRGGKKEYIKMLLHKIKKLSESKKKKLITKLDAYKKVRKATMPKSIPMKNKKAYDRKNLKKGKYD